jgi:DNA-binding CsgD family transcriptional regulator
VAAGRSFLSPEATQEIINRVREGTSRADPLAALSNQEKRVLDLIGEGLTNRQIAGRMALSEKTVKNYVSSVLTKLGMHRRSQAAAMAARLGERPAAGLAAAHPHVQGSPGAPGLRPASGRNRWTPGRASQYDLTSSS